MLYGYLICSHFFETSSIWKQLKIKIILQEFGFGKNNKKQHVSKDVLSQFKKSFIKNVAQSQNVIKK